MHTHIVKPGEVETCHDQVGYWLWEPATGNLIQTVAIPCGQTVMALGHAVKDATAFELVATRGALTNGICSNPFLAYAFKMIEYRIRVTINDDGTWAYHQETTLLVHGQKGAVPSSSPKGVEERRHADAESPRSGGGMSQVPRSRIE